MPAERRGARASESSEQSPNTAVDLFAGAGGASAGLRAAGISVLAAVENSKDAADSYAANHGETLLLRNDILDVDPVKLAKDLSLEPGDLTVLNACPPCQGFSTLGAGSDDDPRNDLIASVWPFVSAFRPRALTVENVPGIRKDHRLTHLLRQARAIGYTARGYAVEAADLGVPQRRLRHLVIAVRDPVRAMPEDIGELLAGRMPAKARAVRGVFSQSARITPGSDPHHVCRALRPKTLERVAAIPVGGTRFDLPEDKQLACHRKLGQRDATGPYGRMRSDAPAPTLTTRCTTVSCGAFIHPTEDRGITLREAALIQTFPAKYAFRGGYDSIERQIGNALPPRVAELVATAVLGLL